MRTISSVEINFDLISFDWVATLLMELNDMHRILTNNNRMLNQLENSKVPSIQFNRQEIVSSQPRSASTTPRKGDLFNRRLEVDLYI